MGIPAFARWRVGRHWVIRVRDEGPGVSETELASIFRPFYRSKIGRSWHGSGGHGVGLAMVARIVQAHDGDVSAKNRESGGLEITMNLPTDGSS